MTTFEVADDDPELVSDKRRRRGNKFSRDSSLIFNSFLILIIK